MRRRLRVENLRALVDAGRISQNHWAIRLGLSRGHWSDLLNGRHLYPSPRTQERLLETFGVEADWLFEQEDVADTPEESAVRRLLFSRYQFLEELGRGGTGTVFAAQDMRLHRIVAIKVIQTEAIAGVGAEALLKEISHVAQLNHPNILPLYDAGEAAGQPYFVMQLVREGSLRKMLGSRARLPLNEALGLLTGIARGLAHSHARQTLHCDIKPENVLVQDGHAYLMDFGIARKLQSEADEWRGMRKHVGYSAGTPAYVSPEQAAGDREIDQRSDVFSLACMAYEMLSGRLPFEGTTTRDVITRRFRAPPPPLRDAAPDIPEAVAEVIRRAMSISPDHRPDSALAFIDELRAASLSASRVASIASVAATRAVTRVRSRLGIDGPVRLRLPFTGIVRDTLYTFRGLRRDLRFTVSVLLSLALGLGIGMPAISLADHLLARTPQGVSNPERVFKLVKQSPPGSPVQFSNSLTAAELDGAALARSLQGVAAYFAFRSGVRVGESVRPIKTMMVTPNYFDVLGVRPYLGRIFLKNEDVVGATVSSCVIAYRYWQREFNGQHNAIGQVLRIAGVDYTIRGVAPEGFNGVMLDEVEVFLPIHTAGVAMQGTDPLVWTSDNSAWLRMVARVRDGVSIAAAEEELTALYRRPGAWSRDAKRLDKLRLESMLPARAFAPTSVARTSMWMSIGAALLFVLIAANLVNLFIARALSRARQSAIRIAVGGGAKHLLKLHLYEAVWLAIGGAALGLLIAIPGSTLIRALVLPTVTWTTQALDTRVVAFAFILAVGSASVAAIAALRNSLRAQPADLLRSSAGPQSTSSGQMRWIRVSMLLSQSAVFTLLLCLATAFVFSLQRAVSVGHGFDPQRVIVLQVQEADLPTDAVPREALFDAAAAAVRAMPGVEHVSFGYTVPWYRNAQVDLAIPGVETPLSNALFDMVSPEYLQTMGMRMREGRWIDQSDRVGAEAVIVVNETFSRLVWPKESALGKCVRLGDDSLPCRRVVGVVSDLRVTGGADGAFEPLYYIPRAQGAAYWSHVPALFVRTTAQEPATVQNVRIAAQRSSSSLPLVSAMLASDNLAWFTTPLEVGSAVFTAFGVLAGLIAAIGLSGLLSYLVRQEQASLAVRLALGAPTSRVVRPIVARAVGAVGIGQFIGIALLLPASALVEPLLFKTRVLEPMVVVAVAVVGIVIALAAAFLPVRALTRIDPMRVLSRV